MFEAWGRALYTRRRLTLGITLVLVAFALSGLMTGVLARGFAGDLAGGGRSTGSGQRAVRADHLAGRAAAARVARGR